MPGRRNSTLCFCAFIGIQTVICFYSLFCTCGIAFGVGIPFEVCKAKKRHRHSRVYLAPAHQQSQCMAHKKRLREWRLKKREQKAAFQLPNDYMQRKQRPYRAKWQDEEQQTQAGTQESLAWYKEINFFVLLVNRLNIFPLCLVISPPLMTLRSIIVQHNCFEHRSILACAKLRNVYSVF